MRECGIVIMEMFLIQARRLSLKKKRWSEDPLADTHLERRTKRRGEGLRRGEKVQGTGDRGDACKLESE